MKQQSLTARQVAKRLGVTVGTLANWRCRNLGPRYYKLSDGSGGRVRYKLADVEKFETERTQSPRGAAA